MPEREGRGFWWPPLPEFLEMHAYTMLLENEPPAHVDTAKLDGALHRLQMLAYYESLTDLHHLTAHLVQFIATAHPFLDGNKRPSYAV